MKLARIPQLFGFGEGALKRCFFCLCPYHTDVGEYINVMLLGLYRQNPQPHDSYITNLISMLMTDKDRTWGRFEEVGKVIDKVGPHIVNVAFTIPKLLELANDVIDLNKTEKDMKECKDTACVMNKLAEHKKKTNEIVKKYDTK